MNEHIPSEDLSAYADGETNAGARGPLEDHLRTCLACQGRLRAVRWTQSVLQSVPRIGMPSGLIAALEERAAPRLRRWWKNALAMPGVWAPAVSFALVALTLLFWFLKTPPRQDAIPVETLLAAHQRYLDEGSVPPADLSSDGFSARLASFQDSDQAVE